MAKSLKLILLFGRDSRIRQLRINRALVGWVVGCLLVLFGLLSYFAAGYFSLQLDQRELQRLRVQTSEQRQHLQRLVVDVERLHQELNDLAAAEARIRQLANLEDDAAILPVAIGGQPDVPRHSVDALQQQINALQLEIELRRQGQREVRTQLNDQIFISRATPKGWPTKGWLSSYFGKRKSPFSGKKVMHEGLDFAANVGTPVMATADGVVTRVEYSPTYGNTVIIDHGYGYRTLYAHNSRILVKAGQRIKRGDNIAQVGNTGLSTGPHLHYEVHLNGVPINPRQTL
ncbi:MAG: peptidoglycan DD-metalloendopeptidase family protein [Pelovirga sp.]